MVGSFVGQLSVKGRQVDRDDHGVEGRRPGVQSRLAEDDGAADRPSGVFDL